jgi:hypothetical protein
MVSQGRLSENFAASARADQSGANAIDRAWRKPYRQSTVWHRVSIGGQRAVGLFFMTRDD